mgnify:CR=1 FL=1
MATPQLSPGVLVREVDLTVGRADNVLDNIGAIAGPFQIGPVEEAIDITTEQDLTNTFGKPLSTDTQYEYWMSAANYLSYGGILKVVRADDTNLNNSNAGVSLASTTALKIKNYDDYQQNYKSATNFTYAAKNPGKWADGLKICVIDDFADQVIGITTVNLANKGATIGFGVTATLNNAVVPGTGSTSAFTGFLKGIITGLSTDSTGGNSTIDVKIVSRVETVGGGSTETAITYQEGSTTRAFGTAVPLDFVNNAGITRDTLLMRMSEEQWDEVINTNLKSAFNLTKAVQQPMLRARKGSIINMSSVVGVKGNAGQSNYAASKAGLIGFTKSIAAELGSRNIRCNAIAPGFIETEMTEVLDQTVVESWRKSIPLKRGGQPIDVANATVFLASDMSAYITGQTIHVCGGMLM